MQWSYKTVQYELKKEGLLGSSFLDEMEVEQSLNAYGQEGWELVSLFAMQNGLMAIFKQPLNLRHSFSAEHEPKIESEQADLQNITGQRDDILNGTTISVEEALHERGPSRREPAVLLDDERNDEPEEEGGFGGIRIE